MEEQPRHRFRHVNGFLEFIREKGVVGLAIGVLMGGAIGKLVTALVEDIVNPVVGILLGRVGDLSKATFMVGTAAIKWGDFLMRLIDFFIVALVIYVGVKILQLDRFDKKKEPAS